MVYFSPRRCWKPSGKQLKYRFWTRLGPTNDRSWTRLEWLSPECPCAASSPLKVRLVGLVYRRCQMARRGGSTATSVTAGTTHVEARRSTYATPPAAPSLRHYIASNARRLLAHATVGRGVGGTVLYAPRRITHECTRAPYAAGSHPLMFSAKDPLKNRHFLTLACCAAPMPRPDAGAAQPLVHS